jgi:hypothetical protein
MTTLTKRHYLPLYIHSPQAADVLAHVSRRIMAAEKRAARDRTAAVRKRLAEQRRERLIEAGIIVVA